ncbi:GNAT family N-acetyltransferase [Acidisoma cellulosilytica]|uniref:GNAT family N-acetyltransferase n=1 Tax=Acidisoma cellulosilyticum TaxID=2802395 RepID=A0A964E6V1_9PROT|nr:GNAT family N-acetyltransferase [Acidisoma cellulosilyticum]MCB8883847.1 GNAT family N-acetyltransferase [Acidisoma cellulosilyticum]
MAKPPAPHPILLTPRLCLRQFRTDDTDAMHACFADHAAMRFWDGPAHTKRIETERAVRRFIACHPPRHQSWAVADATTDRCLGLVNYHDRHPSFERATLGYMIDPACQRQGIATEALGALLDYCFGPLGLHRVQAFIDPDNTASRRLVESMGFRAEGVLRDSLRVGKVWRSDMLYALLATDPRAST